MKTPYLGFNSVFVPNRTTWVDYQLDKALKQDVPLLFLFISISLCFAVLCLFGPIFPQPTLFINFIFLVCSFLSSSFFCYSFWVYPFLFPSDLFYFITFCSAPYCSAMIFSVLFLIILSALFHSLSSHYVPLQQLFPHFSYLLFAIS